MPIKLGNTSIGAIYLGSTKISEVYLGSVKVFGSAPTLPPYTIRLKFEDGATPTFSKGTLSQVSEWPNVWDLYYDSTSWAYLCENQYELIEVIAANTSSVTSMTSMFEGCSFLTTVPLFDTSSVTDMSRMFHGCDSLTTVPLFDTSSATSMREMFHICTSLTTVPLFDTSSVTSMMEMFHGCDSLTTVPLFDTSSATTMSSMFFGCVNVQSGALALYQQASTQANPPSQHSGCFLNCGSQTVTGAQELAQIPSSWGGTGT